MIIVPPKSFIYSGALSQNVTPGIVSRYIEDGNYDILQSDGSIIKRPLIKGDIMYKSTIESINKKDKDIEITLKIKL
jgi:hypothetical protein